MKKIGKIDIKSRLLNKLQTLQLSTREKILDMKGCHLQPLTDPLDRSSMEANQNMTFLIHDRERAAMREIEDALRRIEQGLFGVCETCGGEIGQKRLLVSPSCRLCLACQERQEKKSQVKRLLLDYAA